MLTQYCCSNDTHAFVLWTRCEIVSTNTQYSAGTTLGPIERNINWPRLGLELWRLFPTLALEQFIKYFVVFGKLNYKYIIKFGISKFIRNLNRKHTSSPVHQVLSKSLLTPFWRMPPCIFLAHPGLCLRDNIHSRFISVFNQLDAQKLFHNKFYFMPLHVSSTCAHHQEAKIALHSLWYHHTSRWPSRARVERTA